MMKLSFLAVVSIAGLAHGQTVTFETIGAFGPSGMSSDGSVIVGNDDAFETNRWTADGGLVNLGRGTWVALGRGAGAPQVSDDGTRVSATILTDDGQYITPGVWTEGEGWDAFMPPLPADGGALDLAYGSAWGISGDGNTVVGLYWRPGQADGSAHAMRRVGTGIVEDLGSTAFNSRANAANTDGSVIVGWDENPGFRNWWACVWEDGELTVLNTDDAFCEADSVNADGTIIGGGTYDEVHHRFAATVWRKSDTGWDEELLGALPGTSDPFGFVTVNGITPDGSVMVGYNRFSGPSQATGFIWTPEGGMVDVEVFLADHGVVVPSNLNILVLSCVSDNGRIMAGTALDNNNGKYVGFMITITPDCAVDFAAPTGVLDFFDVQAFLGYFAASNPAADLAADGQFDFFDVQAFLNLYSAGCP